MQGKPVEVIRHIDTGRLGFYGTYTGRSVGRIIHFLYDIYKLHNADRYTIGSGEVMYARDLVATYSWLEDTDVPIFDDNSLGILHKQTEFLTEHGLIKE
jgi:hypothetical protein